MRSLQLFACLLVAIAVHAICSLEALAQRPVVIGYQKVYAPWLASVGDANIERITGRKIVWMPFDAAPAISLALDAGLVQVGLMNSAAVAAAASRDVEMQVVWVMSGSSTASALVVRATSGIDVTRPETLKGKKLAVPFFSATHAHAIAHLKSLNVEFGPVQLINMADMQLLALLQAGLIDGAFVPGWSARRLGRVDGLTVARFSGETAGTPVFYTAVADRTFVGLQQDFLTKLTKHLADASETFQKQRGELTAQSAEVIAVAQKLAGSPEDALEALSDYTYPERAEQRTTRWLGGGRESGVAIMLRSTSELLRASGRIHDVHDDYSPFVTEEFAEAVAVAVSAPLPKTGP